MFASRCVKDVPVNDMKAFEEEEVYVQSFFSLGLGECQWSASYPGHINNG